MDKELKLCVTIPDDIQTKLKYFFDNRRHEELTRIALYEVANILLAFGQAKKTKIGQFIKENVDALVKEYAEKYPVWEYKALKYASDHKHGITDLITISEIIYEIGGKEYSEDEIIRLYEFWHKHCDSEDINDAINHLIEYNHDEDLSDFVKTNSHIIQSACIEHLTLWHDIQRDTINSCD